jgi:hypothetical protein
MTPSALNQTVLQKAFAIARGGNKKAGKSRLFSE